ncbi:hypothetical protein BIW11_03225 [Tropilaelaps mercedesae]|uniref:Uncharacterized protein n=1 Tax=Tropilaelaps mercedesae TaxID=418985 RepID=A0A1V9XQ62_9ACAR|nr:hypothetical protein BIW11_03225 [Tropilaelaps mercedesae]
MDAFLPSTDFELSENILAAYLKRKSSEVAKNLREAFSEDDFSSFKSNPCSVSELIARFSTRPEAAEEVSEGAVSNATLPLPSTGAKLKDINIHRNNFPKIGSFINFPVLSCLLNVCPVDLVCRCVSDEITCPVPVVSIHDGSSRRRAKQATTVSERITPNLHEYLPISKISIRKRLSQCSSPALRPPERHFDCRLRVSIVLLSLKMWTWMRFPKVGYRFESSCRALARPSEPTFSCPEKAAATIISEPSERSRVVSSGLPSWCSDSSPRDFINFIAKLARMVVLVVPRQTLVWGGASMMRFSV